MSSLVQFMIIFTMLTPIILTVVVDYCSPQKLSIGGKVRIGRLENGQRLLIFFKTKNPKHFVIRMGSNESYWNFNSIQVKDNSLKILKPKPQPPEKTNESTENNDTSVDRKKSVAYRLIIDRQQNAGVETISEVEVTVFENWNDVKFTVKQSILTSLLDNMTFIHSAPDDNTEILAIVKTEISEKSAKCLEKHMYYEGAICSALAVCKNIANYGDIMMKRISKGIEQCRQEVFTTTQTDKTKHTFYNLTSPNVKCIHTNMPRASDMVSPTPIVPCLPSPVNGGAGSGDSDADVCCHQEQESTFPVGAAIGGCLGGLFVIFIILICIVEKRNISKRKAYEKECKSNLKQTNVPEVFTPAHSTGNLVSVVEETPIKNVNKSIVTIAPAAASAAPAPPAAPPAVSVAPPPAFTVTANGTATSTKNSKKSVKPGVKKPEKPPTEGLYMNLGTALSAKEKSVKPPGSDGGLMGAEKK